HLPGSYKGPGVIEMDMNSKLYRGSVEPITDSMYWVGHAVLLLLILFLAGQDLGIMEWIYWGTITVAGMVSVNQPYFWILGSLVALTLYGVFRFSSSYLFWASLGVTWAFGLGFASFRVYPYDIGTIQFWSVVTVLPLVLRDLSEELSKHLYREDLLLTAIALISGCYLYEFSTGLVPAMVVSFLPFLSVYFMSREIVTRVLTGIASVYWWAYFVLEGSAEALPYYLLVLLAWIIHKRYFLKNSSNQSSVRSATS
ncbi:MAG: hypothetical protein ABEJ65_04770, partial [bacterium]